MGFRQSILSIGGCAALMGLLYALWYQLGPEAAKPDLAEMREYRLSKLTDEQLRADIAQARKIFATMSESERERAENSAKEYEERYHAWEIASAPCKTDQAFKFRNEELCNGPP